MAGDSKKTVITGLFDTTSQAIFADREELQMPLSLFSELGK